MRTSPCFLTSVVPRWLRPGLLQASLLVALAQTDPLIIVQPQNQAVSLGSNVTFTVTATGTDPLTYQWQFNGTNLLDGLRVSGATTPSLTIANLTTDDSGPYSVLVSNSVGWIASSNAVLAVLCGCSLAEALDATALVWETGSGYGEPWSLQTISTHDGVDAAQSGLIWWSDSWIQTTVTGPTAVSFWWRASFHPGDHLRFLVDSNEVTSISGLTDWLWGYYGVPAGTHQVRWNFTKDQPFGMYDMRGYLDQVVLGPATLPLIVIPPATQSVPPGHDLTLTAAVSGLQPMTCQWQFQGTNLPGATNVSLTLTNLQDTDAGDYWLVVANCAGAVTSQVATITVSPPPGGGGLAEAVNATNLVWETGSGYGDPWSYETNSTHDGVDAAQSGLIWWSDSWIQTTVTGPTAVSFWWRASFHPGDHLRFLVDSNELASISGDSGWLWAYYGVPAGTHQVRWNFTKDQPFGMYDMRAYLDQVSLAPASMPVILVPPATQPVPAGHDFTLTASVSGLMPITYQWQFQETDIPGATNLSLTLVNLQATNASDYRLVVANCVGTVTSQVATITVLPSAPFITLNPASQTAYVGIATTFTAAARGTDPLSYQWQFNGTNIAGATDTSLILTSPQFTDAGPYTVVVSNAISSITSAVASLTVKDPKPVILAQPVNREIWLGSNTTLTVQADGYSLRYQWKLNGTNLTNGQFVSGATSSTLNLSWVGSSKLGDYFVTVSNNYGNAASAKATVSCKQVAAAGAGTNYSGDPHYGQAIVPAGLNNVVALAGGRYHSLALKSDGTVVAWGAGTNYGGAQSVHQGQSLVTPALTNVTAIAAGGYHSLALKADGTVLAWGAGTNQSAYAQPDYRQSIVPANLTNVKAIAAGVYHSLAVKTDGTVVAWGWNYYAQTNVPAGLSNVVAVAAGYTHSAALRSDGTVVVWGAGGGQTSDPYHLTNVPVSLNNAVAIAAGDYHNVALRRDGTITSWGKFAGNPPATSDFVAVAAGGSHCLGLRTNGTITAWSSNTGYEVSVPTGVLSIIGVAAGSQHNLAWLGDGSVVIKRSPANCSVYAGSTTNLTVLAIIGSQFPMSYQWQFNGTNLSGATRSALTLANVSWTNTGLYRAIVTNRYSAATSAPAMLLVTTAVVSTNFNQILGTTAWDWTTTDQAPWFGQSNVTLNGLAAQSGPITDGQESILTTTVTGPGNLSFYWRVSSEEWFDFLDFSIGGAYQAGISGITTWQHRTFPVPAGLQVLQWRYSKDPSLSAGQDAGFLDTVVFQPDPPLITAQPLSQTVRFGTDAQFHVTAGGVLPLTYQWLRGSTNLPGATNAALVLTNISRADAGLYAVNVLNPGGVTSSSNALLTVQVPQQVTSPLVLPGSGFRFASGYLDGWPLQPEDLARFEFQASSNLLDWVTLTNTPLLINGQWLFQDADPPNYPSRFYRVIEH